MPAIGMIFLTGANHGRKNWNEYPDMRIKLYYSRILGKNEEITRVKCVGLAYF